jgi:hypothetical protein
MRRNRRLFVAGLSGRPGIFNPMLHFASVAEQLLAYKASEHYATLPTGPRL